MKSLAFATIVELQAMIAAKEITAHQLLDYFLERFKKYDPHIKSAIQIFDKPSIIEQAICSGSLVGIPGLIKDNICQQGRITACSSKILQNFYSPYDATAVVRLKQEGAYLIGRANCDEFAMGSSTETSAFGKTYNPWDISKVPGGSSGGSIAAVAAGLVPWSLGSETGGSVRQPAAFCGIVGLKPTYGLISRYGLIAYASSLDQIGIATRTVKDNAIILSVIAGQDIQDSSSLPVQQKDYTQGLTRQIKPGLKIGVIDNMLHADGIDPQVKDALEQALTAFKQLGATIKHITMPSLDYSAAVYFILSRAEAASNLARFDGVRYGYRDKDADTLNQLYERTRQLGFGKEVKARIMIGNFVLSVGHADQFYKNAQLAQTWMRQEFTQVFRDIDVLFAPTTPTTAFPFEAFADNTLQMDLQDYFTCAANIAGIPALAVPCGMAKEGLPIGFQLMGPSLSESLLLQTAFAYEQATPWHTMHPQGFE